VLAVWCFVTLIRARGHRSPYALLFPATILSVVSNALVIALEIIYFFWDTSTQLTNALFYSRWFLTNWSNLFLYLSLITVLWNRETVIHSTIEGRSGQHNRIFTVIYTILAMLIFVFGTVGPAVTYVAVQRYATSTSNKFDHLFNISIYFGVYVFGSSVIVTGIVVAISTFLLWKANRVAGITDKVILCG
jgi:hypothetical protein